MRLFRSSRVSPRSLTVAAITVVFVVGAPLAALADWAQFQGSGGHNGLSDGPSAPLALAWTNDDVELDGRDTTGGLSSPVIAEDGTIVVVAPTQVLGFDGEDGSEVFSVERDFGPSAQPAIGAGPDGPIVVYTEGFGDSEPTPATASATVSPSPSEAAGDGDGEFDSHVNAVDLETGELVWRSAVQLEDVVQTPVAVDGPVAYIGDVGGRVTAVELASGEVRWIEELGTPISGAVTLDEGRALVTTLGGREEPSEIVALDAESGDERWRASAEDASNFVSAPVVADGRVLTLDVIGGILAFDAEDGRFLWRTEVVNPIAPRGQPFLLQGVGAPAPVSADGRVFAVDVTGRVYAFDAETGAPQMGPCVERSVAILAPAPHRRSGARVGGFRHALRGRSRERPSRVGGRRRWVVPSGDVGCRRTARRRDGVRGRRGGGVRCRPQQTFDRRAVADHPRPRSAAHRVPPGRGARGTRGRSAHATAPTTIGLGAPSRHRDR